MLQLVLKELTTGTGQSVVKLKLPTQRWLFVALETLKSKRYSCHYVIYILRIYEMGD